MEVTEASVTERSRLCSGGLVSSPALTDRLMAEWGIKAPGVLNGYSDLNNKNVSRKTKRKRPKSEGKV